MTMRQADNRSKRTFIATSKFFGIFMVILTVPMGSGKLVFAAEGAPQATPTTLADSQLSGPALALTHDITLKVNDATTVLDALISKAESYGGYFTSRDDISVSLRIPIETLEDFLGHVKPLGTVVQWDRRSDDLSGTLVQWRTRLQSRSSVFDRYMTVLKDAGPDAIISVEHEIIGLVQEIEQLKGSIRLAEHKLAQATVTVRLQFRDRRPPSRDGNSSFVWLNSINLADLLESFGDAKDSDND